MIPRRSWVRLVSGRRTQTPVSRRAPVAPIAVFYDASDVPYCPFINAGQ